MSTAQWAVRVAVLMACVFAAAGSTCTAEEPESVYVPAPTVQSWLEEDRAVTFLDVREADEFEAGHLPGARNIPYDRIETIAGVLPHDHPIVTYCIHSAHRAPEAATRLRKLGFANAYVLEGGIVAWHAGGLRIYARSRTQVPAILPKTERCQPSP